MHGPGPDGRTVGLFVRPDPCGAFTDVVDHPVGLTACQPARLGEVRIQLCTLLEGQGAGFEDDLADLGPAELPNHERRPDVG
jgi:hypothetical protein